MSVNFEECSSHSICRSIQGHLPNLFQRRNFHFKLYLYFRNTNGKPTQPCLHRIDLYHRFSYNFPRLQSFSNKGKFAYLTVLSDVLYLFHTTHNVQRSLVSFPVHIRESKDIFSTINCTFITNSKYFFRDYKKQSFKFV